MIIAGTEGGIALWAFTLTCFVTGSKAVVTKAVEAFGQHSVLSLNFARRTGERLLVLANLLLENLVHV